MIEQKQLTLLELLDKHDAQQEKTEDYSPLLSKCLRAIGLIDLANAVEYNEVTDPETGINFEIKVDGSVIHYRFIEMRRDDTVQRFFLPANAEDLDPERFANTVRRVLYLATKDAIERAEELDIKGDILTVWYSLTNESVKQATVDLIYDVLLSLRDGIS